MTGEDITRKLQAWLKGDDTVLDDLLPLVIANTRETARRRPNSGPTLNTTALVNEAWLRLVGANLEPANREHFLAVVARAMRQILIDHARACLRTKRGGGTVATELEKKVALTDSQIKQLVVIDELLKKLDQENLRRCQIFEMRFFGGFDTVISDYRLACAWLRVPFGVSFVNAGAPE